MGWARRYAVVRTPSRVRRAPNATPTMNTARPSRARSSDGLRKRTRSSQLAKPITPICGSCATLIGKWIALTFQLCRRCLNGHLGTPRHSADNFGSSDAAAANLQRMGVPVKALEPWVSSLADAAHQQHVPNLLQECRCELRAVDSGQGGVRCWYTKCCHPFLIAAGPHREASMAGGPLSGRTTHLSSRQGEPQGCC